MFEPLKQYVQGNSAQKRTSSFFSPVIQPKLAINQQGDSKEQEADIMADRVMRMPDPVISNQQVFFKPSPLFISKPDLSRFSREGTTPMELYRKCDHCEEEEKKFHRKESNFAYASPGMSSSEVIDGAHTENYLSSIQGGGSSLPSSTREFFEPRFGCDFSEVKIHSDSRAHESARSVNALAYTYGNNIVFGATQFSPESESGKKLLAHELTHVVQQRNESRLMKMIQRRSVWNQIIPIESDYLLIFDVDDGDFVGGCVRQIVPHGGIKLVEKGVKTPIFDIHFGVFKNAAGEFCMFFYESVSGTCLTDCSDDLDKTREKFNEWVREKVNQFLEAIDKIGRFLVYLIQLALMVAIAAMMIIIAGMLLALA